LKLNWKRPLFWLLTPILIILVFVGFPIPVPPQRPTRPSQTQEQQVEDRQKR
jgi:hypothetical protein